LEVHKNYTIEIRRKANTVEKECNFLSGRIQGIIPEKGLKPKCSAPERDYP